MRLREDVSLFITKDLIDVLVVEALGSYLNSVYSQNIIHTTCTDLLVSQRRCCCDNDGWCQYPTLPTMLASIRSTSMKARLRLTVQVCNLSVMVESPLDISVIELGLMVCPHSGAEILQN